ncbi:CYTH domain-containing protein [Candidatus Gracilibacteria bacterium]|nr:CYTH domain-containing protein [Candidatus Gracilibacteria bacterium]NUJ98980.1 CYTH domain-containing protein [Candidatus Gracilibacteria bacterium]
MAGELLQFGDFDSDEKIIIKDILENNEHNFYGLLGGVFLPLEEDIGKKIELQLKLRDISHFDCSNISLYIDNFVKEIIDSIKDKKIFHTSFLKKQLAPSISYRLYIFWIIEILKKTGFSINKKTFFDVPNLLAKEIYNVFQDKALTTFFIILKSFGILDYTINPVNEYEQEKEIKILEINKKELISHLHSLGAKLVFSGFIEDTYFDYFDLRLDRVGKRSFRIRKKISKEEKNYFYTIKRKAIQSKEGEPRICYEKEFIIHHFDVFQKVLEAFGLKKIRKKEKQRHGYVLEHTDAKTGEIRKVKFDIDDYEEMPTLLEIECDETEDILHYIKILGLKKNKTLSSGSRGLYRHYGKYEEYKSFYKQSSDGTIIWQ